MMNCADLKHAGGRDLAFVAHTVGGVGVRKVCLLTSLLDWAVGSCLPPRPLFLGVVA